MEQLSHRTAEKTQARLTIRFCPSGTARRTDRKVLCILYDSPPIASAEVEMFDSMLSQRMAAGYDGALGDVHAGDRNG